MMKHLVLVSIALLVSSYPAVNASRPHKDTTNDWRAQLRADPMAPPTGPFPSASSSPSSQGTVFTSTESTSVSSPAGTPQPFAPNTINPNGIPEFIDLSHRPPCSAHGYFHARGHPRIPHRSRYDLSIYPNAVTRTLPFHNTTKTPPITLATQMSGDRLEGLKAAAGKWNGPLSVALLVCDRQDLIAGLKTLENTPVLQRLVTLHVVVGQMTLFPINAMRNVAMEYADTEWVFVTDADAIPNAAMSHFALDLKEAVDTQDQEIGSEKKTAYMVPAFEFKAPVGGGPTGEQLRREAIDKLQQFHTETLTKVELVKKLTNGSMTVMHPKEIGYAGAFNLTDWIKAGDLSLPLHYIKNIEPYFIAKRPVLPFDERFIGRGTNKISLMFEMFAAGWHLRSLSRSFIIDTPHVKQSRNQKYEWNREELRAQFLHDVDVKYSLGCPAKRDPTMECFWQLEYDKVIRGVGPGHQHFKQGSPSILAKREEIMDSA